MPGYYRRRLFQRRRYNPYSVRKRTYAGKYKRFVKKYRKYKRPFKRWMKKKTMKKFSNNVKRVVLDRLLPQDLYTVQGFGYQDATLNGQGMLTNGAGNESTFLAIGSPNRMLSLYNWLSGFIGHVDRFFVRDERCKINYRSATNVPIFVEWTIWRCRRDLPFTTDWTKISVFFNYFWTYAGGTAANNTMGVTPFQNSMWCHYFKCIKKIQHEIKPGDSTRSIDLRGSYRCDYIMDGKFVQNMAFRNRSIIALPRVWGSPIHDSTNVDQVGTSVARLDYVVESQYRIAVPEDSRHDAKAATGLGGITTARTAVTTILTGATPVNY